MPGEEDSPQGVWDSMAERVLLEFAESGCPIFRATSPLSRGKLRSKGHVKLSIHYAADLETIETILRIIVSANQLSLYGAIAEICEEYENPFMKERGDPLSWGNQVPHSCSVCSRQKYLWIVMAWHNRKAGSKETRNFWARIRSCNLLLAWLVWS